MAAARLSGGLRDLPGGRALFVPAVAEGGLRTRQILDEPLDFPREVYLAEPPRSLAPHPDIEAAFDPSPLPVRASRIHRLEHARVVGDEGAVIDPETGELVLESALGLPVRAERMARQLLHARVLRPAIRVGEPAVVMPSYASGNYFHFLVEGLSRLYAFSDDGRADLAALRKALADVVLLLHERQPRWQRELVELLGLEARYIALTPSSQLVVDRLLLPTFPGILHPDGRPVLFPRDVLAWLRRILREAAEVPEGDHAERRLFVTRRLAGWRLLVNEGTIESELAAEGYETVACEELSVREQIHVFAGASHIVAPHGAGLANMLHATSCTVVELLPPAWTARCYYTLAASLGHSYWYLVGRTPSATPGALDYEVAVEDLGALLEAAGAAHPANL